MVSEDATFREEVKFISEMFLKRGYPSGLVAVVAKEVIKKRIDGIFQPILGRPDRNNGRGQVAYQGWRWTFFICAIPGFIVSAVILLTVQEPLRVGTGRGDLRTAVSSNFSFKQKLAKILNPFLSPSLLLLCLAGSIRNAGGYVWAYNAPLYFNLYYPETDVGLWLSWIPMVGGSFGVLFGGFISDRVVKRKGIHARIWVLVLSQMIAAPFLVGALWFSPPYSFLILIPAYIIGEMWVGVTLAILVELVPPVVRTSAVAFYLFIITNIGGNVPLLVPPLTTLYGLRIALLILYPGMYVLADGLQCYGCNIIVGTKYINKGCSNPEVITCSHYYKGFKHRFCIKTESMVSGVLLTSGCATSRHCQLKELPGVKIDCCEADLCNSTQRGSAHGLHAALPFTMLALVWAL
ncbi:uncharacterized protein LOC122790598 [Protopterus annectens]|uniref:uncharacterized protein LOC122790598 n=1 Tax=Protopterus annectens TaxID=7888 RepID=UPI001CFB9320|nr:uncharacterized protein LOC122790598 [Protopterus annectens]